jgi:tetratricopeptide (TPR) repeat protein
MPAGSSPSPDYWRELAQINWRGLFYADAPKGVALFLDLKKWIEKQYKPDFLLIDARTGITEIGGTATTILADKVICLLLNNRENLEGAREVLRSIKRAKRLPGLPPVEILPVLCRIPTLEKTEFEENLKAEMLAFLNAVCEEDLSCTLEISEGFILHSEPELQIKEALRVGGERGPDVSPLLRDYIRLFTRIIPAETIQPHVTSLIEEAWRPIRENPDNVQQVLEELARFSEHPDAYRSLLQYFRLRHDKKAVRTAYELWRITNDPSEPLIWETVRENFEEVVGRRKGPFEPGQLQFVEAVWRAAGANDQKLAFDLAESYDNFDQKKQACRVLRDLLNFNPKDEEVVYRLLRQLRRADDYESASRLIEDYGSSLSGSEDLLEECARVSLESKRPELVQKIPDLSIEKLSSRRPLLAARLAYAMGRRDDAKRILTAALPDVLTGQRLRPDVIEEFARAFNETGILSDFRQIVRAQLGPERADRLLENLEREFRPLFME